MDHRDVHIGSALTESHGQKAYDNNGTI